MGAESCVALVEIRLICRKLILKYFSAYSVTPTIVVAIAAFFVPKGPHVFEWPDPRKGGNIFSSFFYLRISLLQLINEPEILPLLSPKVPPSVQSQRQKMYSTVSVSGITNTNCC